MSCDSLWERQLRGFPSPRRSSGTPLFYVALFNIVFNILLLGRYSDAHRGAGGFDPKLLINPGIAASVAGFVLFLGSVGIPSPSSMLSTSSAG